VPSFVVCKNGHACAHRVHGVCVCVCVCVRGVSHRVCVCANRMIRTHTHTMSFFPHTHTMRFTHTHTHIHVTSSHTWHVLRASTATLFLCLSTTSSSCPLVLSPILLSPSSSHVPEHSLHTPPFTKLTKALPLSHTAAAISIQNFGECAPLIQRASSTTPLAIGLVGLRKGLEPRYSLHRALIEPSLQETRHTPTSTIYVLQPYSTQT
jgi:hypothetical protein